MTQTEKQIDDQLIAAIQNYTPANNAIYTHLKALSELVSIRQRHLQCSTMRYMLEKQIREDVSTNARTPAEKDLGGRAPASEEEF